MTQSENSTSLNPCPNLPTLEKVATVMLPTMRLSYERRLRWISWVAFAICLLLMVLFMRALRTQREWSVVIILAIANAWVLSLMLSAPLRLLLLKDLNGVDKLILTGAVYPATVGGSRIDALAAGLVQPGTRNSGYVARWTAGGKNYTARFVPFGFTPPVREAAVVANKDRRVLVVLNGKIYSAKSRAALWAAAASHMPNSHPQS